jgi:hypothetical protein
MPVHYLYSALYLQNFEITCWQEKVYVAISHNFPLERIYLTDFARRLRAASDFLLRLDLLFEALERCFDAFAFADSNL